MNIFESTIRVQRIEEKYEVTIRIESNNGEQPIFIEKKMTTDTLLSGSFDEFVCQARGEFLQKCGMSDD
jgi:hypothetical protein